MRCAWYVWKDIQEKIALATKNWNINEIVNAVIADDPEAIIIRSSSTEALHQIQWLDKDYC